MSTPLSRREVLARMGAAGLAAAGVAGAGLFFHRRPGWPPPTDRITLPSWRIEGADEGVRMVVAHGTTPAALVDAALEELGGIARFVRPGDVVFVKPNAAFDRPAWQGATANPEVVGAVVRACLRAGAAEVLVTDNPIHAPEGCFRKTGIGAAVEAAGGTVLLPRPGDFRPASLPGTLLDGWPVYAEPLERATKVIGVSPIKDHNLARASLSIKNWYGILGGPRNRLHQKMDETIGTLAALVRPTLSVLDGSRIMIRNGPTGGSPDDLRSGEILALATDPVALDAWGAGQLGLAAGDLPYLARATELGAGTSDWRSLEPKEIQG